MEQSAARQTFETREKLIAAARTLIAERAFGDISVEEITRAAGVAKGSFYTYFKRKEDIVPELGGGLLHLAEVSSLQGGGILGRLVWYCNEYAKASEHAGLELCRQQLRSDVSGEPLGGGIEAGRFEYDSEAVEGILKDGIARGELSASTPVQSLALLINAQLYGLTALWCMSGGKVSGAAVSEKTAEGLLYGLLKRYIVNRQ